MDIEPMPLALRLAAIVALLSASALRGTTCNKTDALCAHLAAAAGADGIDPRLRSTLEQVLAGWQAVDCQPTSISSEFFPLTVPGQLLH